MLSSFLRDVFKLSARGLLQAGFAAFTPAAHISFSYPLFPPVEGLAPPDHRQQCQAEQAADHDRSPQGGVCLIAGLHGPRG